MANISFVASATPWSSSSSGTGFTINKPSGVAAGDLMIALLSFAPGEGNPQRTVTVPSGWTKQNDVYANGPDDFPNQICVMTRQATASEPSTWSGSISSSSPLRMSGTVAYRNVLGILAKGTSSKSGGSSYSTATVNNTKAGSWRVTLAAYESGSTSYNLNTNEVTSRVFGGDSSSNDAGQIRMADSNAAISTGNTSRTVSRSANWSCSTSWIGILELLAGTPGVAEVDVTLGSISTGADGEVHNDAPLDADLGGIAVAMDGYGVPPDLDGPLEVQLGQLGVAVSGGTVVRGSVDTLLPVSVDIVGETRFFGIRVIVVEFDDSRLIRVQPRAVED